MGVGDGNGGCERELQARHSEKLISGLLWKETSYEGSANTHRRPHLKLIYFLMPFIPRDRKENSETGLLT